MCGQENFNTNEFNELFAKNFKLKFVIINVVFGGWEFYFQIYNFVLPQQHSYKVDRGKSNISYMVAKIGFLYSV